MDAVTASDCIQAENRSAGNIDAGNAEGSLRRAVDGQVADHLHGGCGLLNINGSGSRRIEREIGVESVMKRSRIIKPSLIGLRTQVQIIHRPGKGDGSEAIENIARKARERTKTGGGGKGNIHTRIKGVAHHP